MNAFQIEPDLIRICLTGIRGPNIAEQVMRDNRWQDYPIAEGAHLPLREKLEVVFNSINRGGIEYMTLDDKRICLESIEYMQSVRRFAASPDGYTTTFQGVVDSVARRFSERASRKPLSELLKNNSACIDEIVRMRTRKEQEIASELGYREFHDIPKNSAFWSIGLRLRNAYDDEIKRHIMDTYNLTGVIANALIKIESRG